MKKKKRTKINTRNIIIIILVLLIIVFYKPVTSIFSIKNKGYNLSISYKIYKEGIKDIVLDNDYSKVLDNIIDTDFYDKKYLNNYFEIDNYERNNFNESITNLLNKGYTSKDINEINSKYSDELYNYLKDNYVENIIYYLNFDYFRIENMNRYLEYFNGDYRKTIVDVNIGLDKGFYQDPKVINTYSKEMLVNKYSMLNKDVELDLVELTKCNSGKDYLVRETKDAYDLLCDASKKEGLSLGTTSSYRSYKDQEDTYNYYLKNNGKEYAESFVARPGFSEHQTGLAIDVKSNNTSPFKTSKEYKWMLDNSYKYGFILRYPEEKESITGYSPESWHYRYVGIDIATYIHDNNLTYEEYCAMN